MISILRGFSGSLQRELDEFCKMIDDSEFSIRSVTKGAFSQARAKLKPEAFLELNDVAVNSFYREAPYLAWHGKRVLAIDGTRLQLPRHKTVEAEFGLHDLGRNGDAPTCMALGSFLYDVANLIILDAKIAPYSSSEGSLMVAHLDKVSRGDILLMDRGYPSKELFFTLAARGIDCCVRMKEDWWTKVREFTDTGKKEQTVTFSLSDREFQEFQAIYPQFTRKTISLRLISLPLDTGETEILCTSLHSRKKFPHDQFAELYHLRWGVEESFKLFKARAQVERFSGKTAKAVKQDFYAKVFTMSLSAMLSFPIEEKLRQEYEDDKTKHPQKVNRTSAMAYMKELMVNLFLKNKIKPALKAFDNTTYQTTEIMRPNRSNPRNHKPKKNYFMNYKPI